MAMGGSFRQLETATDEEPVVLRAAHAADRVPIHRLQRDGFPSYSSPGRQGQSGRGRVDRGGGLEAARPHGVVSSPLACRIVEILEGGAAGGTKEVLVGLQAWPGGAGREPPQKEGVGRAASMPLVVGG